MQSTRGNCQFKRAESGSTGPLSVGPRAWKLRWDLCLLLSEDRDLLWKEQIMQFCKESDLFNVYDEEVTHLERRLGRGSTSPTIIWCYTPRLSKNLTTVTWYVCLPIRQWKGCDKAWVGHPTNPDFELIRRQRGGIPYLVGLRSRSINLYFHVMGQYRK